MNLISSPQTNVWVPRWYQDEAINSIYSYYNVLHKRGNPLLALPTAAGKTGVIAGFIRKVLWYWPGQRFLVATHVKELIEQNAKGLEEIWPNAPFGIYSAGLNSRDFRQPIIYGGVQSLVNAIELIGHRDIMFIDEAHLVGPGDSTRYQTLIDGLKKINPNLKVIGLSATIYRMGLGMLTDPHDGRIFTDICYDLTTMESFARLISEGYLSPLIGRQVSEEIDVSALSMGSNGEFNQKQLIAETLKGRVTLKALEESARAGYNRRSWLAFSSGIEHAEMIADALNRMCIPAVAVHSGLKDPKERDRRIRAHKEGQVRCLVGNNIFTTGYDHRPLDFIIDLQPTLSTPKHVQKNGRGMRVSPETYKENCLVMDYGGNFRRLGPINDPVIPKAKGKGNGEAPIKVCEECGTYNHISARECMGCGAQFEFRVKIVQKAETEIAPIRSTFPEVEFFDVTSVLYFKRMSRSTGIPFLVCMYFAGLQAFEERIFVESPKAKHFYHTWWRQRHGDEPPKLVDEALKYQSALRIPKRIKVWTNKTPMEILSVEF